MQFLTQCCDLEIHASFCDNNNNGAEDFGIKRRKIPITIWWCWRLLPLKEGQLVPEVFVPLTAIKPMEKPIFYPKVFGFKIPLNQRKKKQVLHPILATFNLMKAPGLGQWIPCKPMKERNWALNFACFSSMMRAGPLNNLWTLENHHLETRLYQCSALRNRLFFSFTSCNFPN